MSGALLIGACALLAVFVLRVAVPWMLARIAAYRRADLEYAAAFWRRAAMRASWRGDDATERYAERQYRACEARLERGGDGA